MGEISSIVKDLYGKFLMRDLLSFIVPGAIVITSLALLFVCPVQLLGYVKEIPGLMYIPIFGFCFVIGYALQSFGTLIFPHKPMLKYYDQNYFKNEIGENYGNDAGNMYEDDGKKACAKRNVRIMNLNIEKYSEHRERIMVLKQMCGNNAVALCFSGIICILKYFYNNAEWYIFVVIGGSYVAAIVFLWCAHRQQVGNQMAFENAILCEDKNPKTRNP